MAFKLATAYVDIEARMQNLGRQLNASGNAIRSWMANFNNLSGAFGLSVGMGAAIAAGRQFIASAIESHDAEARLRAVIQATGGAAGKTADEILEMASAMQAVTGTSDEMITDAASKMLTFKSVTGETFDRAMKAAADLSATGFGSIQGAAVQLGKALEDPVRGLGALRRAGVTFTEEEKKLIKELVATNQLLKAQEMILKAVEGQVGGVAEAMGKTPAGQWKSLMATFGDIGENFGKVILPAVLAVGKAIAPIADGILAVGAAIGVVAGIITVSSLFTGWGIALVAIGAVAVAVYELGQYLATIPAVQKAWNEMTMKLQYAWQRLGEVFTVIGNRFMAVFGGAITSIHDGFIGFVTYVIEGFGNLMMEAAEWALVIVQNFGVVRDAVWAGLKFIAGATFDLLTGGFRAAFNVFIDIATRTFAMIPRLLEAGFEGGLAGLAGQMAAEVADAITVARKEFGRVELSEFTKNARNDMMKAAGTLAAAKGELERGRPGAAVPPAEAKKIAAPAVQEVVHKIEMPTGLMGITDAWRSLQEAMLKSDSPEERAAESLKNGEGLWQEQVDAQLETNQKLDKLIALDSVV